VDILFAMNASNKCTIIQNFIKYHYLIRKVKKLVLCPFDRSKNKIIKNYALMDIIAEK